MYDYNEKEKLFKSKRFHLKLIKWGIYSSIIRQCQSINASACSMSSKGFRQKRAQLYVQNVAALMGGVVSISHHPEKIEYHIHDLESSLDVKMIMHSCFFIYLCGMENLFYSFFKSLFSQLPHYKLIHQGCGAFPHKLNHLETVISLSNIAAYIEIVIIFCKLNST